MRYLRFRTSQTRFAHVTAAVTGVLLLFIASPVASQQPLPIQPGDTIRVSVVRNGIEQQFVGPLGMLGVTELVLRYPLGNLAIPRDSVTRIEVSRGKIASMRRVLLVGGLAGGALGAIVGIKVRKQVCDLGCAPVSRIDETGRPVPVYESRLTASVTGALVYGGLGLGLGALAGATVLSRERWVEVGSLRLEPTVGVHQYRSWQFGITLRL